MSSCPELSRTDEVLRSPHSLYRTHCINQVGHECLVPWPETPEFWDDSCEPPYLAWVVVITMKFYFFLKQIISAFFFSSLGLLGGKKFTLYINKHFVNYVPSSRCWGLGMWFLQYPPPCWTQLTDYNGESYIQKEELHWLKWRAGSPLSHGPSPGHPRVWTLC